MKLGIYGLGNFGYSFLRYFDRHNNGDLILTAFDYKPERVTYLTRHRRHPLLHTNTKLSSNITFVDNPETVIKNSDVLLVTVPSTATREVMQTINKHSTQNLTIVNTAKALELKTGKRLSEVAGKVLNGNHRDYAIISGGTVASDMFAGQPLGASIASQNSATLKELEKLFSSESLFIDTTTDLAGVEYAGAFKNIVSILAGSVNGLGLSFGTETHIISRTAQQIADACVEQLGAKSKTFSIGSQCWGNDMWMSAIGKTRNREFGELIGSSVSVENALEKMSSKHKIVEGMNTLEVLPKIKPVYQIPILKLLHEITIEKTKTIDALKQHITALY